jgi:hypothetical protein
MSMIVCLRFATTSTSHYSISINLCCASTIVCTYVACYIVNYTSMNKCSSCVTMFSSIDSCTICASTKWCSSTLFSFNSSMHAKSIDVAPSHVCSLACQRHLLLRKNSTTYFPVVFMSLIIVYANYIFSLYAFLSTHSKDNECNYDLIANKWIFKTYSFYVLLNSSSIYVFFNNSTSSYLCMWSFF